MKRIDRSKLTAVDQLAYDVFENSTAINLRGYAPNLLKIERDLPIDHFSGFQTFYPDFASGQGAAPFKTTLDYDNNLKRNAEYAVILDRAIGLLRQGMKDGIVQPKLVVNNMIGQFDNLIKEGVEGSTFYGPVKKFPDAVSAADQTRLRAAYAVQIRDVIVPAEQRMRDFLAKEYLAKARDTVGLSAMPGGDKLYAFLIEQNTTLPLSAEDVHNLGLSEVARITKEMETQKQAVGFKGTLAEFFTFLRTDPRFAPQSAEKLREGYEAIEKRIYQRIPEQFSLVPKTRLEVRPVPAFKEKTEAGGSYQGGTPDGSRPGVFYYNTYDLPSRYTWEMETLFLHEGVPGHHFQISLAQENTALPAFMRFGGNTAYVEGWALYSGKPVEGSRDGNRSVSADGRTERRNAARDAAGGRQRNPCQGLDARPRDRLHARQFADGADRCDGGGGTLHRHSGSGACVQGRPADHRADQGEGEGRARREVRSARLSCASARQRIAAECRSWKRRSMPGSRRAESLRTE